jgi:hypothetical protein
MKRSRRDFPFETKLLSGQKVTVGCATKKDLLEVRAWAKFGRKGSTPAERAAVKMALNAQREWKDAQAEGLAARDLNEATDMKSENPSNDTYLLFCITGQEFSHGRVLGLFLVRRNWNDSMFADYIATHPVLAKNPESTHKGVGTLAFYSICKIARKLNIRVIRGETTPLSRKFYQIVLKRRVYDIVAISRKKYQRFLKTLDPGHGRALAK